MIDIEFMAESITYELVFEGLRDSTPDILRKLRTALVADLNFSADQAKQILSSSGSILRSSHSVNELQSLSTLLERAGASVSLRCQELRKEILSSAPSNPAPQLEYAADTELHVTPDNLSVGNLLDSTDLTFLDPIEQVTDLFRDLEEACVIGEGEEVLKSLPTLKHMPATVTQDGAVTKPPFSWRRMVRRAISRQVWLRKVSWIEVLFSVVFSVVLALVTRAMTL